MWTKRERVVAALSGEKPDRVPIFDCVCHDGVLEHFGGGPIAAGDFNATVRACSKFLDLCHPALVPREPSRAQLADGREMVVERWTVWTTPGPPLSTEQMAAALEKDVAAWENAQPGPDAAANLRKRVAEVDAVAGDMVYIHLGGGCAILPFGGMAQGMYAWMELPDLVRRWNRAVNQASLRNMQAVADGSVTPVCILFDDIACKGRLIYPPALLEEFFYPHLAALMDLLHSRGVRTLFHSDGDCSMALRRLIECGIDGFNPLEISAGMDPRAFRQMCEACGRRVALVGGIDAVDVLAHGTPDLVARETRELIDLFRREGNLIMASASGEIDNSMPTENVLAMYETTWRYGVY
jgi:hypothetical protein